ncbi:hypothetical protein GGI22_006958, partial [Coemansia erecta]
GFKELSEHFISQGMHIDYPLQSRSRGGKEVDTDKPFVPIRLLIPHKTCGAIIGQKSETLINTRINCAARRVYVYRERIADSRERIVEIVGTPRSISRVMKVLGSQIGRTLSSDQRESDPYVPERDGLRKFLSKQGVPRARISLEAIKSPSDKGTAGKPSDAKQDRKRRSRSRSASPSRSPSSERSKSRSRNRDGESRKRSGRQRKRQTRSASPSRSVSPPKSRRRRDSQRKSQGKARSGKSSSGRHNDRNRGTSLSSSLSRSRSRSRSRSKSPGMASDQSRSRSRSRSKGGGRKRDRGSRRGSKRGSASHKDEDADMYDSNQDNSGLVASDDEVSEAHVGQHDDAQASQNLENPENNAHMFYYDNAGGSAEQTSFQGGSW